MQRTGRTKPPGPALGQCLPGWISKVGAGGFHCRKHPEEIDCNTMPASPLGLPPENHAEVRLLQAQNKICNLCRGQPDKVQQNLPGPMLDKLVWDADVVDFSLLFAHLLAF
jgi:hypothetical protein